MNLIVEMTLICYLIIFTLVPIINGGPVPIVKKPTMGRADLPVTIVPSEILTTQKTLLKRVPNLSPSNTNVVPEENLKEKKSNPNKISSFDDYYDADYMGDSANDASKNKNNMEQLRSTTRRPQSWGCPHTHSVCQHYCESDMYYSGYCEGDTCHCYGKL